MRFRPNFLERVIKLLKNIFEQLIYSEGGKLIDWQSALSDKMRYTFQLENGVFIRITVDSPYPYSNYDLLKLIRNDFIHIMDLILWENERR